MTNKTSSIGKKRGRKPNHQKFTEGDYQVAQDAINKLTANSSDEDFILEMGLTSDDYTKYKYDDVQEPQTSIDGGGEVVVVPYKHTVDENFMAAYEVTQPKNNYKPSTECVNFVSGNVLTKQVVTKHRYDNQSEYNGLCWWCCHTFQSCVENKEFTITAPRFMKKTNDGVKFITEGYFCSYNCAKSYTKKFIGANKVYLLSYMCATIHKHFDTIVYAPPRECLKSFGGHMDIIQFRENFKTLDTFTTFKYPLSHYNPPTEIEQKNIEKVLVPKNDNFGSKNRKNMLKKVSFSRKNALMKKNDEDTKKVSGIVNFLQKYKN